MKLTAPVGATSSERRDAHMRIRLAATMMQYRPMEGPTPWEAMVLLGIAFVVGVVVGLVVA